VFVLVKLSEALLYNVLFVKSQSQGSMKRIDRWWASLRRIFGTPNEDVSNALRLATQAEHALEERDTTVAISLYEKCLVEFRALQSWDSALRVRIRVGYLFVELQDYRHAREHLAQPVSLAANLSLPQEKAAAMISIASVASLQGEYSVVERICAECQPVFSNNNDVSWLAHTQVFPC
jgi:hypothetical protein